MNFEVMCNKTLKENIMFCCPCISRDKSKTKGDGYTPNQTGMLSGARGRRD